MGQVDPDLKRLAGPGLVAGDLIDGAGPGDVDSRPGSWTRTRADWRKAGSFHGTPGVAAFLFRKKALKM